VEIPAKNKKAGITNVLDLFKTQQVNTHPVERMKMWSKSIRQIRLQNVPSAVTTVSLSWSLKMVVA